MTHTSNLASDHITCVASCFTRSRLSPLELDGGVEVCLGKMAAKWRGVTPAVVDGYVVGD